MAALISLQLPPDLPQRSHCHRGACGALFHVPGCTVSVWPFCAIPVICGGVALVGGEGEAICTACETATFQPPVFSAVSWTSIHSPTSSEPAHVGVAGRRFAFAGHRVLARDHLAGAAGAFGVAAFAAEPLLFVGQRFVFPAAAVGGQLVAFDGHAGQRRRGDELRRRRFGFFARRKHQFRFGARHAEAFGVGGAHQHGDRSGDVRGTGFVGAGRDRGFLGPARDRFTFGALFFADPVFAEAVAAQPRVGEAGRVVGPAAGFGRQRLALREFAGFGRGRAAERGRGGVDGGAGGGQRRALHAADLFAAFPAFGGLERDFVGFGSQPASAGLRRGNGRSASSGELNSRVPVGR